MTPVFVHRASRGTDGRHVFVVAARTAATRRAPSSCFGPCWDGAAVGKACGTAPRTTPPDLPGSWLTGSGELGVARGAGAEGEDLGAVGAVGVPAAGLVAG